MKKKYISRILIVILLYSNACSKNIDSNMDQNEKYYSINQIPDKLFAGGDFYGIWQVDSIRTLSGHYYKGGGSVRLAFTNDGKIVVENLNNIELSHVEWFAPNWRINPWYFISGVESYTIKVMKPSNEFSTNDGFPHTGTFDFTNKKELWTAHFSNEKVWMYHWASGNPQVHIWAKKVK